MSYTMASGNQNPDVTNVHGDHIASCLCCLKFRGDMGDAAYSEATPEQPAVIECMAGEFKFDQNNVFAEVLPVLHNRARHCVLFVPRQDQEGKNV